MSTNPIFTTFCDGAMVLSPATPTCRSWAQQADTKRAAQQAATRMGWVRTRGDSRKLIDLCPPCWARLQRIREMRL